jgi:hypothetical protein
VAKESRATCPCLNRCQCEKKKMHSYYPSDERKHDLINSKVELSQVYEIDSQAQGASGGEKATSLVKCDVDGRVQSSQ